MYDRMHDLKCRVIQVDAIWCYVGKKQINFTPEEDAFCKDLGDQYVFVSLDPETKLISAYEVGKRNMATTRWFTLKLVERLSNRVQLKTNAFVPYSDAIELAFGSEADYAKIQKSHQSNGQLRYSPPRIVAVFHLIVQGAPQRKHNYNSHVERQNLTMKMQMRRLTRRTNGLSNTLESFKAAVTLHFTY